MEAKIISIVIPVYRNEESLPELLAELENVKQQLDGKLEVVFVVDGSPDNSYLYLSQNLKNASFKSQLLLLSRNFGSFAAIRAGMEAASGDYFAIVAADLQEPLSLALNFYKELSSGNSDIAIGQRTERDDPFLSRMFADLFWKMYKKYVMKDIPEGGVDVFACNKQVRDQLLALQERNSSLVALLFWVGFRRAYVPYQREKRKHGKSAWTFRRKLVYLFDSFISFTDLPIQMLLFVGVLGLVSSIVISIVVLVAKLAGFIGVVGYTPTILALTFFGGLNCFGLGIIGGYVWRSFENTKSRPLYIVSAQSKFNE